MDTGWGLAADDPGIDIPDGIDFHILQPFFQKAGAHEPGPFGFVEGGGGDLLEGDRQVEQTRD